MAEFMQLYLLRMIYVGVVVIGLAAIGTTVFLLLKRTGKLGSAAKVVGPVLRAALRERTDRNDRYRDNRFGRGSRGTVSRSVARFVLDHVEGQRSGDRPGRRTDR